MGRTRAPMCSNRRPGTRRDAERSVVRPPPSSSHTETPAGWVNEGRQVRAQILDARARRLAALAFRGLPSPMSEGRPLASRSTPQMHLLASPLAALCGPLVVFAGSTHFSPKTHARSRMRDGKARLGPIDHLPGGVDHRASTQWRARRSRATRDVECNVLALVALQRRHRSSELVAKRLRGAQGLLSGPGKRRAPGRASPSRAGAHRLPCRLLAGMGRKETQDEN